MRACRPHLVLSGVAVTLGALLASSAGGAAASIEQPGVVSARASASTPHLAATDQVKRPMALAVEQAGDTTYVGGKFLAVQDSTRSTTMPRSNMVAFSSTTGDVSTSFAPTVDGMVFAVRAVGDSVYIGGKFTSVDGVARPAIAKLDARTGALDTAFQPAMRGGRISEIRLVDGRLLVGGTFRQKLIALDPTTGRNTGYVNVPIDGRLALSTSKTEVYRFAVNPAGTRLIGVGNFTTVGGENRKRAFMLNLGTDAAELSQWYYPPLDNKCLSNTPTRQAYLEDVDFAPDGSYFVFGATGYVPATTAEIGAAVCDAVARFETDVLAPTAPTWINYTGGDTIHSVSATGAAVYVQGHFRWLDNPSGKDSAGPGAVDRRGVGAVDSSTGEALSWAPQAPAAQGGQDILATDAGVWFASDSQRFGGRYHRGIAFAPLP